MKSFVSVKVLLSFAMFFLMSAAFALPAGWKSAVQIRKAEGNLEFAAPRLGEHQEVSFLVSRKDGDRHIRIGIRADGWAAEELDASGRSKKLPPLRVYPRNPDASETVAILFKIREDEWSYYVDGRLAGSMAAPFALPGEISWPARPGVKLTEAMRFHPVPRASFKTDFMIEPGAPNELYPWSILQGTWHLHTAQAQAVARPETDQRRAKEAPLTADKSPNFYSLKGGGANADCVITTGYDFYDNYTLTGSMQLEKGEAGLIFYHRDAKAEGDQAPDPAKASYYAMTIRMDAPIPGNRDIRLWKQEAGKRTVLARASIPLYNNQWLLPGIKVHGDEVICMLDNYELFRVQEQLPPGGKIGLFANTPEEIRFDDITLTPHAAFDLSDIAGLRHNAIYHTGAFLPGNARLGETEKEPSFQILPKPQEFQLHVKAADRDEMLILGRAHNQNMYFAANAANQGSAWNAGLIAGWTAENAPYYRFTIITLDGSLKSRLCKINSDGTEEELDVYDCPDSPADAFLQVDATESGVLRCYLNGLLVHYQETGAPIPGACGLFAGKGADVAFHGFQLSATREVIREQEQKNPIFKEDSFMRHWASPEGQWISGGDKLLWFKGDFFGDFIIKLPVVPGSEVQIAVPDGKQEGAFTLRVSDKEIELTTRLKDVAEPVVQHAPLAEKNGKGVTSQCYEVCHEGSWLWLKVEGETVLRQRLNFQPKSYGTRVLAKNMSLGDMAKSKITRTNVLDEYFNESPHGWLANGGDWQIINRFQCTPSWSHMIDECPEGLGAFWLKQVFQGDMTLEFYAGTRHNYYDKAGNLNCTIMAKDTTPSSGYTVACTEWDQNQSQNWTTFYRNGVVLDKTDAYLVPRRRKGMYRRILNPLVSQGRPIHGAWFYIKLRKIGKKLEYYFDDELLFTQTDENMIQEGLVGIWSFVHSMTLAQIKMTFDGVRPRPIPVTMLPVDNPVERPEKPQVWEASANGFPLDALNKRFWSYSDMAAQGKVEHFSLDTDGIMLVNKLGGGEMKLTANLPPTPFHLTAGWRFKVKRTPKAMFNFFYTIKDGDRVRRCFHRISGDSFSEGAWRMTGETEVKPVESLLPYKDGWTEVTVWIPDRFHGPEEEKNKSTVSVGGFGIEQLDATVNGIWGNGPEEGYAIADFRPVFFGKPELAMEDGAKGAVIAARDAAFPKLTKDKAALAEAWKAIPSSDGINNAWFLGRKHPFSLVGHIEWIQLPEKAEYTVTWDKEKADQVCIHPTAPYADWRMDRMNIKIAGTVCYPPLECLHDFVLSVPRTADAAKQLAGEGLVITTTIADDARTTVLKADDPARNNAGPVLRKLDGLTPFLCTFEDGSPAYLQEGTNRRISIQSGDPAQGKYLRVRNTEYGQALNSTFNFPLTVSAFPVVQFRYRAWDMAQISMIFHNSQFVHLTKDDSGPFQDVRLGKLFDFDEKWHTWTGIVSDAFISTPYTTARFTPKGFRFGSLGSPDQTGRYSKWNLDDFSFGPAVHSADQLAFTPDYYDADGVSTIQCTVLQGNASAYELAPEALEALPWTASVPGAKITPAFPEGMKDGISHVVIRAKDTKGNLSSIIDVPFQLTRSPMNLSHAFQKTDEPLMNGTRLAVSFGTNGGAPLQIDKARFFVNGKEQSLPAWTNQFCHSQAADILYLNYPFIFRKALNGASNGNQFLFEIDGITDGAGNTLPRYTIPVKVDYASDSNGPAWYEQEFGSSVLWNYNWDGRNSRAYAFSHGQYNDHDIHIPKGASPFIINYSYYSNGDLSREVKWKIWDYPCISFRLTSSNYRASGVYRLVLDTTDGKQYTISLTRPGQAGNELNRSTTFKWENNKWLNFSFNVRNLLLKIGVAEDNVKNMVIKNIDFQRRGMAHHENLFLDDFFIHGMPQPGKDDVMNWSAYDASGVASLEVTCMTEDGKPEWTHSFPLGSGNLNELRAKFKGIRWFHCQAKDKAGKLSVPFWLPVLSE